MTPQSLEVPIAEFEGEFVRKFKGRMPPMNLDMDRGYKRGTHLNVLMELRVRDVAISEDKDAELTRQHNFTLEAIQVLKAFTAEEADPGVGGNAAGNYVPPWVQPLVQWIENGEELDFGEAEIPPLLEEILTQFFAKIPEELHKNSDGHSDEVVDAELVEEEEEPDVGF